MRKLVPAVIAAGLLAALSASAAEAGQIVSVTGAATVNGRPAPAAPFALQPGQRFATPAGGSAVFRSDAGDEIKIDSATTIRHEGLDAGVEYVLVVRGTATGTTSGKTTLGAPSSWATAPQGTKSEVRVEVPASAQPGNSEGRFRALKGQTWLRNGANAIWLPENNSVAVTVDANNPSAFAFRCSQQNDADVTTRRTVSGGDITARAPRASSGTLGEHPGNRTKIANDITSSKSSKLLVTTNYGARGGASIGPGTFALIDNSTGAVETFLAESFDFVNDDVSDYDPVESGDVISQTRRSRR